jgi:hypothetical protein
MSIIYPLAAPAQIVRMLKLAAVDLIGEVTGEFDGSQQEQQWQGQWWELEGSWPPMLRSAGGEAVACFLTALHGKLGTFTWGDPEGAIPQGTALGNPVAWGAVGQRSQALTVRGLTPNQQGVFLPGDYIQPVPTSGNVPRLYKNLTVANADSSGHATLDIFPSIREALTDGTQLLTRNCVGTFRLIDNRREWAVDVTRVYGITFKAKEAI